MKCPNCGYDDMDIMDDKIIDGDDEEIEVRTKYTCRICNLTAYYRGFYKLTEGEWEEDD